MEINEVMGWNHLDLQEEEYFLVADWMQKYPNLSRGFTSKNGGISKGDFTSLNVGFHVKDT